MRYVAFAALLACHVEAPRSPSSPITDVVLFRDAAVITRRLDVELGTSAHTIELELPAGATDIAASDIAGIATAELRVAIGSGGSNDADASTTLAPSPRPTRAHLDVTAPHPGHYALAVSYVTDKLTWMASYTIATNRARDRATLFGALAVTNASGLALAAASGRCVSI